MGGVYLSGVRVNVVRVVEVGICHGVVMYVIGLS